MGLFKKVFGTGDTTLTLHVDEDRVPTGGTVTLRWEVGGELDEKVRAVRAGVTATGHWIEHDRDHDDHGGVRREIRVGSDGGGDVERRSAVVWSDEQEHPPALGPGEATFTLPPDAPPGSKGVLKWTAWVAVDREKARDHREEATLYVRRPPVQDPEPADLTGDGLAVTGIPSAMRLGARHAGTVALTVPEAMKGTLRLVLVRRVRHVSSRHGGDLLGGLPELLSMPKLPGTDLLARAGIRDEDVITRQEEEVDLDLSGGKQEFEPGRPHEFSFDLEVPGRGPTTAHDHAQVDWRVVVKLDRTLRGDLRVAAPVDVS